jgi:hypothetical protein
VNNNPHLKIYGLEGFFADKPTEEKKEQTNNASFKKRSSKVAIGKETKKSENDVIFTKTEENGTLILQPI